MKDTIGITKTSLLRFHELYSRVKEKKKKNSRKWDGGITFFPINPDLVSRRQRAEMNNRVFYRNTPIG